MTAISKSTFQFLKELKKNNNREWFNSNKERYLQAKADFEMFIETLIAEISKFDKSVSHNKAKDCVFRIYRDVRFSKDKSPYKTHFAAHITATSKKTEVHSRAGYYVHLSPGHSMLAGGAYMPESSWLKAIREEIDYNSKELKKILNSAGFRKYFGQLEGEKLKTVPKGYSPDHPEIELLKYKSFLAMHYLKDNEILSPGFSKHAANVFHALHPFDSFLNATLD